jgi:hypothetical protein
MSVHTSQPRPPSPVPKAMPMRNAVGCSLQVQVCPRGRALHTVQGAFPSLPLPCNSPGHVISCLLFSTNVYPNFVMALRCGDAARW